jgi:hypothetical protein
MHIYVGLRNEHKSTNINFYIKHIAGTAGTERDRESKIIKPHDHNPQAVAR